MKEYSSLLIIVEDNHKDYLLLQHRDNNPQIKFSDFYSLFGGEKKPQETPEQALKREIKEEIGLILNNNFEFYKRFLWKEEYSKIVNGLKNKFPENVLNSIQTMPEETEKIIDNLYISAMTKEQAESLNVYEGKKEIVPIRNAISLKIIPSDKLMILHYLNLVWESGYTDLN